MKCHLLSRDAGGIKPQALIVDEEVHVKRWGHPTMTMMAWKKRKIALKKPSKRPAGRKYYRTHHLIPSFLE